MTVERHEGQVWELGDAYDRYMGRWSRSVAAEFVRWLDVAGGRRWLDVGCGSGALTATVLELAEPLEVAAVDPSAGFVEHARTRVSDDRATFSVGTADALEFEDDTFDVAVSGLVLNFVADPGQAVAELARVVRPGGVVASYVWNYGGGMQLLQYFWDAARDVSPAERELDEAQRFSALDGRRELEQLWATRDLTSVESRAIDIPMRFADFDDYWSPFLGGQGPGPAYVMALDEPTRARLRERLRETLPAAPDGSIELVARAWAVRGSVR